MAQPTEQTDDPAVTVDQVSRALRWLVRERVPYHTTLKLIKGGLALAMIEAAGGVQCRAAEAFRVHRNTLQRDLDRMGVRGEKRRPGRRRA
jgi:DNA-binding protein Fis